MLRAGEKQTLEIVKKVDFGVYLAEAQSADDRVLLPNNQLPPGAELGTRVEVFLYFDSSDRLIATRKEPKLVMDEFKPLTVVGTGKIGAFLDWGLEKDLFLPFKEQVRKVSAGDCVLTRLYLDKSGRLCGSTKGIYQMLQTDSPYEKDATVTGRVYDFSDNFGIFVAVDDRYSALIPHSEPHPELLLGQEITARVLEVKEDGKLTLTLRQKAYLQIQEDANHILEVLDAYAGVLPFTEKADAEVILRETGLSKNAFKRAVGHLYKEHQVLITDHGIRKVQ